MTYFLTVRRIGGEYLHKRERFDSLESVLKLVSDRYLDDPPSPFRLTGYFFMREGELARFQITQSSAGKSLREDIALIDIISARAWLEMETWKTPVKTN